MKKIHNIAVALKLSGVSGRDILNGISKYAKAHAHWRFHIFSRPEDFTPEAVREIPDLDGIITSEHAAPGIAEVLEQSAIPLVVIGMKGDWIRHRTGRIAFVRNDDEEIGRMAANYLHSLGRFRSFAFVPSTQRTYWSLLREKGFRAQLRSKSIKTITYSGDRPLASGDRPLAAGDRPLLAAGDRPLATGDRPLNEWLRQLPKPAAVFAAFDERAIDVLAACSESGIGVPQEVAVIGVDNDELLCDFCSPSLTSILPDHASEGYVAAQELNRLLKSTKSISEKTVRCHGMKLIRRASTSYLTQSAHLVDQAVNYIRNNATGGLRCEDVARHLGVSRRLVDLRLREAKMPALSRLIAESRLDEVARRLRETDDPIRSIAAVCAFANLQHLANAFKRRFGRSMTAYRHSARNAGIMSSR